MSTSMKKKSLSGASGDKAAGKKQRPQVCNQKVKIKILINFYALKIAPKWFRYIGI